MESNPLHILLADDSRDDRLLFKEALSEIPLNTQLYTVADGEELMYVLENKRIFSPHVLFLDLNMPRKNGFECLEEMSQNGILKSLPVIVFSTSYDKRTANILYKQGAQHYIRKPYEFDKLVKLIHDALIEILEPGFWHTTEETFVLHE